MDSTKMVFGAILNQQNKPLILDYFSFPQELDPKLVVVEMKAAGICGKQLDEISGKAGHDKFLPHLLGHEGYGRVVKVGEECLRIKVGDLVCLHWRQNSTEVIPGPIHSWKGKKLNAGPVTAFSQYTICAENKLTKIPEGIEYEFASILGCAYLTGYGIVKNDIGRIKDSSILIFGAGGIGLSTLLFSSIAKVKEVYSVDYHDSKLDFAKSLGSERLRISELSKLNGKKFDFIIDTTSDIENINFALNHLKPCGKIVLVGVPTIDQSINLPINFLFQDKQIIGSHGGSVIPKEDIPEIISLKNNNQNIFKLFPSETFDFKDINFAIENVKQGNIGRAILEFSREN
jgi:Zn-dependent alcohol dehydrogenase